MLNTLIKKTLIASAISVPVALSFTSAAVAAKEDFWIENNTSVDLTYLYVSESSLDNWGEDVLGPDQVLIPGTSLDISFGNPDPQVCIYDIRGEFADGDVVEKFRVNVCSSSSYEFYETQE